MAGFKNREELLDLLLDDTEETISEIVKSIINPTHYKQKTYESALNDIHWIITKLEKLDSRIVQYRKMNPKQE